MGRGARIRRLALRAGAGLLLAASAFVGWRWGTGNHGTVVPGAVYRSAQLSARGLERTIRARGIRTVVNLRGCNPDRAWYRAERAATLRAGAAQVDLAMASDLWLTRDQLRALVEVLETGARPLLIHCEWGAERTGLASAVAELLRPGGTLAAARAQFAPYYLFLPAGDGARMRAHLDRYAAWLRARGVAHDRAQFLRWALSAYRPGSPSREEWPYDPYPLVVVTRPPGAADPACVGARPTARAQVPDR